MSEYDHQTFALVIKMLPHYRMNQLNLLQKKNHHMLIYRKINLQKYQLRKLLREFNRLKLMYSER